MIRKLDLIVTGTGRCATEFYAKFLTSAGLPCGHEVFFSYDGLDAALDTLAKHWTGLRADSSWLAAPFLNSEPLKDAFVIHLVRHPKEVIESRLRVSPFITPEYPEFAERHFPLLTRYRESIIDWSACHWLHWNLMIEREVANRLSLRFNIERDPIELLSKLDKFGLFECNDDNLFDNHKCNAKPGVCQSLTPADICDELRGPVVELAKSYGYTWTTPISITSPVIKAIVTTLDNLPNLQETIPVLRSELIDEIVIVNNGSEDGTREWLATQPNLTVVNRENNGAGPGRNAGLDAAGEFDYVLMLDGGIRPLRGGTSKMLNYLRSTPGADVIGIEVPDFETNPDKAWRRWPDDVPAKAYRNMRLSHTAYALCRERAWNGLRFCEDGPFGQPGWGADDDEMAYQWNDAGIVVHVATGIHPYRRASGSFGRLLKDTGLGAISYGSVYEQRLCWLKQNWPQYEPPGQWGEPWLTVVIQAGEVSETAALIKSAHDQLRQRRFDPPWSHCWNPYHVMVHGGDSKFLAWAEPRRLRQHHGDTVILDNEIVRRDKSNGAAWTGDFILSSADNWRDAVYPMAHYYGLVVNQSELDELIKLYNKIYPRQPTKKPPTEQRELNVND